MAGYGGFPFGGQAATGMAGFAFNPYAQGFIPGGGRPFYPPVMRPPMPMGPYMPPPMGGPMGVPLSKYFSIDVECVATGLGHNDRAVAHISLVDQYENVLLNVYVRQIVPVASHLTPLTGLTAELLQTRGVSIEEAMAVLRQRLPSNAIIVGQNIIADIRWLGLREGVDYESLLDLSGAYRVFNPKFNSFSYFSLAHEARVVLGVTMEGAHNAVTDAIVSIQLFNRYNQLQSTPEEFEKVRAALIAAPLEASFAKKNPSFEGVCMGNKKTCTCGQAFVF